MTDSKKLTKELGLKLKEDYNNYNPNGNLYYVMDIRLQDAIIKTFADNTGFSEQEICSLSSKASKIFLQGIIELADKHAE